MVDLSAFEMEDGECLCSRSETDSISVFNAMCAIHGHLASPQKVLVQRWCTGSSEPVGKIEGRTGTCRCCGLRVPQKYGHAGVHLPDGSTPRV